MRRLFSISVFFIITISPIFAQSHIRLNNYWGNAHFINPASIYDKYLGVFSVAYRNQWAGWDGAPVTLMATGMTYLENYDTQLAFNVLQDKSGYMSQSNINFSYAFAILFENDWQFHFGMGGSWQNLSFDLAQIRTDGFEQSIDLNNLVSENAFNADLGFEFTNPVLRIGGSSLNLVSLLSESHRAIQTNVNIVFARYRPQLDNIFDITFGICGVQYSSFYEGQYYADMYQLEFNASSIFKSGGSYGLITRADDLFDVGFYYRTGSGYTTEVGELGLIIGFNISESFHISYGFDYNFGSVRLGSSGTNELILTYNLTRKQTCHTCWY